ncbi:hypothetical protein [Streptomyces goshikiensis]|uniref:hypothetical protein n=1 Tax=Streptomyces goshikiensis TaxID=1942 RepID=UPI0033BF667A
MLSKTAPFAAPPTIVQRPSRQAGDVLAEGPAGAGGPATAAPTQGDIEVYEARNAEDIATRINGAESFLPRQLLHAYGDDKGNKQRYLDLQKGLAKARRAKARGKVTPINRPRLKPVADQVKTYAPLGVKGPGGCRGPSRSVSRGDARG